MANSGYFQKNNFPQEATEKKAREAAAVVRAVLSWGGPSDPNSIMRHASKAIKNERQRNADEHKSATGLVALMKPPANGVAMVRRIKKKRDLSEDEEIQLSAYIQCDDWTYIFETVDGHRLVGKLVCESSEAVLKTKVLFQLAETIPVEGSVMDNLIAGFYWDEENKVAFYEYTLSGDGELIVKQVCLNLESRTNTLFMVEAGIQGYDGHVTTFVQVSQ